MSTIALDPKLYKNIDAVALRRHRSVEELVSFAVALYLDVIEGRAAFQYQGKSEMELFLERMGRRH